ncbi:MULTISPECIES: hypothetical protein [Moorena]|uniref:Uncharacterized protein n=1 Tax=Moorena producens 3L TaxID=489825 RepID=F4XTQ1_9CYAN|nr:MULTISPECIES: hypothetical protein [Moorena]NEQ16826.1 hypothetical protein [Moorena sp. SIO3E2]EGJ31877.1 hypothetical protein LYNGBM3L_32210 [Moorena producens 3L]NEP64357.1 hypothetical protein [Moorena sp. SIO3A5]NEQ06456.1 hypothetical protein [Moorena sp. SIO4E2]NES43007.1 hypothetical protein [Moorena sp. SIO2C4]
MARIKIEELTDKSTKDSSGRGNTLLALTDDELSKVCGGFIAGGNKRLDSLNANVS